MQAQSSGVWLKQIAPGISMTCNTNFDTIYVENKNGNNLRYLIADGIKISDIEQIENGILKTLTVGKARS